MSNTSFAVVPGRLDILCGKDKKLNRHEGNKIFREKILSGYVDAYNITDCNKIRKMEITKEIVQRIAESGARFLRCSPDGRCSWEELSASQAREKVSHALKNAFRKKTKDAKTRRCREGKDACTTPVFAAEPLVKSSALSPSGAAPADACLMDSFSSLDTYCNSSLEGDCARLDLFTTTSRTKTAPRRQEPCLLPQHLSAPIIDQQEISSRETFTSSTPNQWPKSTTTTITGQDWSLCGGAAPSKYFDLEPIRLFRTATAATGNLIKALQEENYLTTPLLLDEDDDILFDANAIATLLGDDDDSHELTVAPGSSSFVEPLELEHAANSNLFSLNDDDMNDLMTLFSPGGY